MTFTYYWKTSDNDRHTGEIEASDRETAFSMLRERGIRAIKVEPKGWETGKGYRGVKKRMVKAIAAAAAICGGTAVAIVLSMNSRVDFYRADGTVDRARGSTTAVPITRRQIIGDPERVESLLSDGGRFLFRHPSEVFLAHYARPGHKVDRLPEINDVLLRNFEESLSEPIYTFPEEMVECKELKCIVAGMKEELRMFLASGGSAREYVERLAQRQEMEIEHRGKADLDIKDAIADNNLTKAYSIWQTANERLQSMGIYPLPLPDSLRSYQNTLDFDE